MASRGKAQESHSRSLPRKTLCEQHRRGMKNCSFHPEAGLNARRITGPEKQGVGDIPARKNHIAWMSALSITVATLEELPPRGAHQMWVYSNDCMAPAYPTALQIRPKTIDMASPARKR